MKPVLKAPGNILFKLGCHEPLSNFAFNFKLRRYNKVERLQNDLPGLLAEERARSGPPDIQLDTVFNACEPPFLCSVLVGAANGDWDLLESIDGPCVPHINYSVDQTPVHGSLNDLWARVY